MADEIHFDSFDAVSLLPREDQRRLLDRGDSVERVWAAWALGLELGRDAVSQLLSSIGSEPTAGTRRQLLVVLAGLGERRILRVFAQSDPDEYVRATALQYVVRTAPDDEEATRLAIDRLFGDAAPVVRRTVLQELAGDTRSLTRDHLETLATDEDLDVRRLALRTLVDREPLERLFPALFTRCIRTESNLELRTWLTDLCVEAGLDRDVLRLALSIGEPLTSELLERLIRLERRFGWEDLEPFARLGTARMDDRILKLVDASALRPAFGWLLGCVIRAATVPGAGSERRQERNAILSAAYAAEYRLRELLESGDPIVVADEDRPTLRAAITYLEERREQYRTDVVSYDDWDDEEEDTWDLAEALRSLLPSG